MTRHASLAALTCFLFVATAFVRADEAASIKTLENAKATILRDDQNPEKPVVGVIMWGSTYNGGLLKELKEIKNLQKLRIGGPWISDDGVKELHALKNLQMLEIRSPKVSDGALKSLQEALPKLKMRRASRMINPLAAAAPLTLETATHCAGRGCVCVRNELTKLLTSQSLAEQAFVARGNVSGFLIELLCQSGSGGSAMQ